MTTYQTPDYAPPAPRRNRVPLILGIVGLVLLLSFGGCVALFMSGSKVKEHAQTSADQFLNTVEQRDYRAAEGLLAKQTQAKAGAVTDVMGLLEKRNGKPKSHTGPTGWRVNTFNGVTQVRLGYTEQFERGAVPLEITCIQEDNQWRVAGFNFRL